jgi:hypothetical protein
MDGAVVGGGGVGGLLVHFDPLFSATWGPFCTNLEVVPTSPPPNSECNNSLIYKVIFHL